MIRLERLIDLLAMGQQAQIGAELVCGLPQAGQGIENLAIDFARVGLAGDGVDRVEAHLAGDQLIQAADALVIAAEEGEKTGLRAGRALDAAEAQRFQTMLEFVQIENEIVAPQTGAFADGRELGRLKMRETERGQIAPARGEAGQRVDDADEPIAQQPQTLAHQDQIGIVGDIAAGAPRWMIARASGQTSP